MTLKKSSAVLQVLGFPTATAPIADTLDLSSLVLQALTFPTSAQALSSVPSFALSSAILQGLTTSATTSVTGLGVSSSILQSLYLIAQNSPLSVPGIVTPAPLPPGDMMFFWPNWVDQFKLSHEWQTRVRQSPSTTSESRRGGRTRPLRRAVCTISTLDVNDRRNHGTEMMRLLMAGNFQQHFEQPWPLYTSAVQTRDAYSSGSTLISINDNPRYKEFYPGCRLLVIHPQAKMAERKNHWELVQLASTFSSALVTTPLAGSWPKGTTIIPLMDCDVFAQLDIDADTGSIGSITFNVLEKLGLNQLLAFNDADDINVVLPSFEGRPVYLPKINWASSVKIGTYRDGLDVSQGQGTKRISSGESRLRFSLMSSGKNTASSTEMLYLFDKMLGRLRSFWFVVPIEKPFLIKAHDNTAGYVDVAPMGDISSLRKVLERGALANVDQKARTVTLARYINVTDIGGSWRIYYSGSLGSSISSLTYAQTVRFDYDECETAWFSDRIGQCTMDFIQVLDESPKSLGSVDV